MKRTRVDSVKIGRRGFLGGLAAVATYPALADDGKPLFKVGLVTDTHVRTTRKSCERVELAYKLFKKYFKVSFDCGDCDSCDGGCFDDDFDLFAEDEDYEPTCSLCDDEDEDAADAE